MMYVLREQIIILSLISTSPPSPLPMELYPPFGNKIQHIIYLSMQVVILVLWVITKYDQSLTYAFFSYINSSEIA